MEYLFSVYWKEYRIGFVLKKENKYFFTYDKENLVLANLEGFDKLIGFPDTNKIYESNIMFPIFSSRIKSNERLKKENILDYYDCIDTLINTSGKLVTDNISIKEEKDKINVKSL